MGNQRFHICKVCDHKEWFDTADFYDNDCSNCESPVKAPADWKNTASVTSGWPGGVHRQIGQYFEPGTSKAEIRRAAQAKGMSIQFDGRMIPKDPLGRLSEKRRHLREKYGTGQAKAYNRLYGGH